MSSSSRFSALGQFGDDGSHSVSGGRASRANDPARERIALPGQEVLSRSGLRTEHPHKFEHVDPAPDTGERAGWWKKLLVCAPGFERSRDRDRNAGEDSLLGHGRYAHNRELCGRERVASTPGRD
jgi:hypothetical protein